MVQWSLFQILLSTQGASPGTLLSLGPKSNFFWSISSRCCRFLVETNISWGNVIFQAKISLIIHYNMCWSWWRIKVSPKNSGCFFGNLPLAWIILWSRFSFYPVNYLSSLRLFQWKLHILFPFLPVRPNFTQDLFNHLIGLFKRQSNSRSSRSRLSFGSNCFLKPS